MKDKMQKGVLRYKAQRIADVLERIDRTARVSCYDILDKSTPEEIEYYYNMLMRQKNEAA